MIKIVVKSLSLFIYSISVAIWMHEKGKNTKLSLLSIYFLTNPVKLKCCIIDSGCLKQGLEGFNFFRKLDLTQEKLKVTRESSFVQENCTKCGMLLDEKNSSKFFVAAKIFRKFFVIQMRNVHTKNSNAQLHRSHLKTL